MVSLLVPYIAFSNLPTQRPRSLCAPRPTGTNTDDPHVEVFRRVATLLQVSRPAFSIVCWLHVQRDFVLLRIKNATHDKQRVFLFTVHACSSEFACFPFCLL